MIIWERGDFREGSFIAGIHLGRFNCIVKGAICCEQKKNHNTASMIEFTDQSLHYLTCGKGNSSYAHPSDAKSKACNILSLSSHGRIIMPPFNEVHIVLPLSICPSVCLHELNMKT